MSVLTVVLIVALIATVAALGLGIGSMMRAGELDQRDSNRMMFARVSLHAIVVLLIGIAIYISAG